MQQDIVKASDNMYRSYIQFKTEIIAGHQSLISEAAKQAFQFKKSMHNAIAVIHRNREFVLEYYFSGKHSHVNVYQLVQGKDYAQVFGFDNQTKKRVWYHDHFFYRYAQRFSLKHKSHLEAITHYFCHNPVMAFSQYYHRKRNTQDIKVTVDHGIVLGYLDLKNDIINYRTIINNYSLSPNKKEKKQGLNYMLSKLKRF